MVGTKKGGLRAAKTNKERHGKDFYSRIGALGGLRGTTGGFAADHELARLAGAKGGRNSSRKGVKTGESKVRPKKRIIPWGEE